MAVFGIERLSFEHHHDGLAVHSDKPRISWSFSELAEENYGWTQTSYELEVKRGLSSTVQHFSVESAESVLVPWPSKALASREAAQVRVRAYGRTSDRSVQATQWSTWCSVEASLLSRDDWTSSFVSAGQHLPRLADDGSLRPVRFRKQFELPSRRIRRGRLYSTAHGVYQAYVNGRVVGKDCLAPGWTSYNHRLYYQTHDITALLRSGAINVIGIEAAAGWFAGNLGPFGGRRSFFGDNIAVLAQIEVEFDDDIERLVINSDETWTAAHSAIVQSEIYNGETYDARNETGDWKAPGDSTSVWAAVRLEEMPSAEIIAPEAAPIRVTQQIKVVNVIKSPTGKTILDFGQNLVGRIIIKALQKPMGHRITFLHAEVLENGELGVRPLRFAASTDTLISAGQLIKDWTPLFTFHGFRYVQVDGWTTEDEIDPLMSSSIVAQVIHTDMRRTGWFDCSHPLVNRLHENAVWSMRGNFLSLPTDCPQRDERLGWTGDIQIFSPSANYLYDTSAILGGWLQDVAAEQLLENDGAVPPFVVPDVFHRRQAILKKGWWSHIANAVWDDVTIITPWDLYRAFGDSEVLQRQYASMKAWIDRGVLRGEDGLWDPDHGQLGDWLDPNAPPEEPSNARTDAVLVADAYLVRVTGLIAKVAAAIGKYADARQYAADAARLKLEFQQRYISPAGLMVADTQTALALSFVFDLFATQGQKDVAAARLVRAVRQAHFRVATGFVGTPIITHALTRIGHPQLAYRMLLEPRCPSWLYPISMGATTVWERWDSMLPNGSINPGEMTSFNHYALGSVINWLHETVGGIAPLAPGWRQILVRPVPGGNITQARVRHDTPYGCVQASWILSGETFVLDLVIPASSMAYVVLPHCSSTGVAADDQPGTWLHPGKHRLQCEFIPSELWPPVPLHRAFYMPREEFTPV